MGKLQSVMDVIARHRAYYPRHGMARLRGPTFVQIQTVDRCNAACVMCPYTATGKSGPPNLMEDALYRRILEQLRQAGTVSQWIPSFQSEPLLDPDLGGRIGQAKGILGRKVRVHIFTNGALLTQERCGELLDCGADVFRISLDARTERTYRAIRKGLDFSQVVANVHALIQRRRDAQVILQFLRQHANQHEEDDFIRYWRAQGARVRVQRLSSRTGVLHSFGRLTCSEQLTLRDGIRRFIGRFYPVCLLPFARLAVLWDGRVVLCCHDWGPRDIMGDLSSQSLADVWDGERMNGHRRLLWAWRPEASCVCRQCSVISRVARRPAAH
jgi:MoaA/NifB/PqqE/SkfB family radical SAM enzyme